VSWTPPAREPWVERLNALGRNLGDDGRSLVPLDAATLLAAAQQATGLADFGDDWFRSALAKLLGALESEARLTLLGRLFARSEIQRILQNRLRVEDWIRRHPEVEGERIEAPIFVTGLGRSGTTLLHELLMQDPANRVPLLWETFFSTPPPEPGSWLTDPRVAAAELEITLMDAAVPALTGMHENAGNLPTECIFLFAHQLATDMFTGEFHVPSYTLWLHGQDPAPLYAYHRRLLQLLQSHHRGERWVLKAPSHLSQLPALFRAYPDAQVVVTHRDPLRVIGSLCNLMAALHWMRSDHVDYDAIVRAMSFGFPFLCERVMKQRDAGEVPNERISDLRYADLVRDPIASVRSLYARWGRTLPAEAETRMRRLLEGRRQTRRGAHEYAFETTGLDRETERAKYAPYLERYGVVAEG
jgi:Sulfotransferase family